MVPYEFVSQPIVFTGAGQYGLIVPLHSRGFITKLRVVQLAGTFSGFNYTLYNTIAACTPITGLPLAGQGTTQRALYQVLPTITVPAPQASFTSTLGYPWDGEFGLQVTYQNLDDPADVPLKGDSSNCSRKLYLNITSPGAGTYGVAATSCTTMV
jgi:hypothetical protein